MKSGSKVNTEDYSKVIREMIEHEDDLLNNRMNWLLAVQGLLFAALQSAQDNPPFVYILITFGFLIAISSMVAFIASDRAISNLLGYWDKHLRATKNNWQDYPPVFAAAVHDRLFIRLDSMLSPRKILPLAFALGWVIILILQLKG